MSPVGSNPTPSAPSATASATGSGAEFRDRSQEHSARSLLLLAVGRGVVPSGDLVEGPECPTVHGVEVQIHEGVNEGDDVRPVRKWTTGGGDLDSLTLA